MARVLIALFIVTLTIYTFIDCARTPASDVPARIGKPAWLILIFLVPIIGPVIWLYFKYRSVINSDTPMSATDLANRLRGKNSKPHEPIAPDDDPEFLARLDAVNRRKAYEKRKAQEEQAKKQQRKPADKPEDKDGSGDSDHPESEIG